MKEATHVAEVRSNFKGAPWRAELGQFTLITGNNASGKSRIPQAIGAGLTKAVDDYAGRDVIKTASMLFDLGDGKSSYADLVLSSDATATFKSWKDGKTTKAEQLYKGSADLPYRAVKKILLGGPPTVRKQLLVWSSEGVTRDDVLARIPGHLHELYTKYATVSGGGEVSTLIGVQTIAAKRKRSAASEAKGADAVLEELSLNANPMPTSAQMDEARELIDTLMAERDKALVAEAPNKVDTEAIVAKLEAAEARAVDYQALVAKWAPKDGAPGPESIDGMLDMLIYSHELGAGQCPCCGTEVGATHVQACINHFESAADTSREANEEWVEAYNELARIAEQIGALTKSLSYTPPELSYVSGTVAELDEAVAGARERYDALTLAEAQWGSMADARDRAASMKAEARDLGDIESACDAAIRELLSTTMPAFCKRVTKYLPKRWRFGVDLDNGKVGLMTPKGLHTAMSGVEWAAVTAALSMTVCDPDASIKLVVVEDRAWDPTTLGSAMRSFSEFAGQVIICSPIKPKGHWPANWTHIDIEAGRGIFRAA